MDWKDVQNAVATVAPSLGALLGGPLGGVAGVFVSQALGVANEPSAIDEALKKDPEAFRKLKQAELDNSFELNKLLLQNQIAIEDNLTKRFEAMTAAELGQTTRPYIALMMAWMLCIPYSLIGIALAWIIFKNPTIVKDLWPVLLAYLSIPLGILNKYFGDLRKEHAQTKGMTTDVGIIGTLLGAKK